MYAQIVRLQDDGSSTLGIMYINGTFKCFTLEDTYRSNKIHGKTCIPTGKYDVKLRTEGGMTKSYANKFGADHHGMLWLQDVEDFEWVYIHIGNTEHDTEGCILVGANAITNGKQSIGASTDRYKELYDEMAAAILRGEEVTIEII